NDAKRKLDELCTAIGETGAASEERAEHRDVAILRSLPGIGRINLATLLSEASGPLSRRDYQALRTLSGVAPVTKRSGKSHVVVMRYASHVRLRNTVGTLPGADGQSLGHAPNPPPVDPPHDHLTWMHRAGDSRFHVQYTSDDIAD